MGEGRNDLAGVNARVVEDSIVNFGRSRCRGFVSLDYDLNRLRKLIKVKVITTNEHDDPERGFLWLASDRGWTVARDNEGL